MKKKQPKVDTKSVEKNFEAFGKFSAELSKILGKYRIAFSIQGSHWDLAIPPALPQNVIGNICAFVDMARKKGFTVFTHTKSPTPGFIYGTCMLCEQGDKEILPLDIDAKFGYKRLLVCKPCIAASALASMTKKTTRVKKLPSGWKQKVETFKIGSQNVGVAMTYQGPIKEKK